MTTRADQVHLVPRGARRRRVSSTPYSSHTGHHTTDATWRLSRDPVPTVDRNVRAVVGALVGPVWLFVPAYYGLLENWDLDDAWKQALAQAVSGGSSGILTSVVTNPMDIVRTKAQVFTQYGAMDTLKYILKRDGWRGLMTGVHARMLAMGPSGVLVISSYEFVKRVSRRTPKEMEAAGIVVADVER